MIRRANLPIILGILAMWIDVLTIVTTFSPVVCPSGASVGVSVEEGSLLVTSGARVGPLVEPPCVWCRHPLTPGGHRLQSVSYGRHGVQLGCSGGHGLQYRTPCGQNTQLGTSGGHVRQCTSPGKQDVQVTPGTQGQSEGSWLAWLNPMDRNRIKTAMIFILSSSKLKKINHLTLSGFSFFINVSTVSLFNSVS